MRTTLQQRVLQYINDFKSITTLDAFKDLGCSRLSAKIFDLRKEGYDIKDEWVHTTNRYGDKVKYKRYYLNDNSKEKPITA